MAKVLNHQTARKGAIEQRVSDARLVTAAVERIISHREPTKGWAEYPNAELARRPIILGLAVLPLSGCNRSNPSMPTVELHIASDGDQLAFKPDHLYCRTGQDVRLFFHHAGQIIDDPHDWVLLKPGHVDAFVADADKSPEEAVIIPINDTAMVLAATPLCGKQKTVMVEFTAPAAGDYPFVCSVAGHGDTMRGVLTVTA
jgi:azurin